MKTVCKIVTSSVIIFILFFTTPTSTFAATEFAPHDLTSHGSHLPFLVAGSAYYSTHYPYKAFNGAVDTNSKWLISGTTGWVSIFIGSKRVLTSYEIQIASDSAPARAPKNWTMEGTNDEVTWYTVDTVTGETGWSNGEKRSFTCDDTSTAYRVFRFSVTANDGDISYTGLGEIYLYGENPTETLTDFAVHDMTTNSSHSPYVASVSTVQGSSAFNGFDGNIASAGKWLGNNHGVDWLKLDVGSGNEQKLDSYIILAPDDGVMNRLPKNWTMEGSNDNSNWDTLDTVTNSTGWINREPRLFDCDTKGTTYRYFRLNITANNGDTNYTGLAEFYLFSSSVSEETPARVIRLLRSTRLLGGVRLQ